MTKFIDSFIPGIRVSSGKNNLGFYTTIDGQEFSLEIDYSLGFFSKRLKSLRLFMLQYVSGKPVVDTYTFRGENPIQLEHHGLEGNLQSDNDVSRLVQFVPRLKTMLRATDLPESLEESPVIRAIKNNNFSELAFE